MNIFSILIPKVSITYLNVNDTLSDAVQFMMNSSYSAIPVINDAGEYVGIVSEGDFLKAVMEFGRENLKFMTIDKIVRMDEKDVVLNTVGKKDIMERILDRNFLSVVDDRNIFIGIITRRSILMYLKD